MESIIGFVVSGLVGVSLGLMGTGGSIITVPMLVYLFHLPPVEATSYSLFIVGVTSLTGGIRQVVQKNIDRNMVMQFAIPSTLAMYATRHFLLPAIPDILFQIHDFQFTKGSAIMVLFAITMIPAGIHMVRHRTSHTVNEITHPWYLLAFIGAGVGVLSGLVGTGGGFLIIPTLVLLAHLPMQKAIGTSLVIIAINSLVGFASDGALHHINFVLLGSITALAVTGIFVGLRIAMHVEGQKLKTGFGWFAIAMALVILSKEIL